MQIMKWSGTYVPLYSYLFARVYLCDHTKSPCFYFFNYENNLQLYWIFTNTRVSCEQINKRGANHRQLYLLPHESVK